MRFTEFPFDEEILQGIEKAKFDNCTPVQEETFKNVIEGRDILAQSQTGTGKTAAFLISIFHLLRGLNKENPRAVVVAPTRELADQIEKECLLLGSNLPWTVGSFYGGVGYAKQEKLLQEHVNIIIGTPGRLLDFDKSKKLSFKDTDILVIDEADRMFDMGFYPDLRRILSRMRPSSDRKTLLFSATLNSRVGNIAWEFMNQPAEIVIEPEQVTVDAIEQELYHVSTDEKMSLLLGLLQKNKPDTVIIFSNTKHQTMKLAKRLEINGYQTEYLMGDLPQRKRLKILESMKKGNLPVLVATDVAARGLHINDLDLVVNFDLPNDVENYVHRIGRTARAGKSGKAISLACEKYVYSLEGIEKYIGMKIPVSWATDELYIEDKSKGVKIELDRRSGNQRTNSRDGRRDRNSNSRRKPIAPPIKKQDRAIQSLVSEVAAGSDAVPAKKAQDKPNRKTKSRKKEYSKSKRPEVKVAPAAKSSPVATRRVQKPKPRKGTETLDQRLEYYKKKYGENFKAEEINFKDKRSTRSKKGQVKEKKTFLGKIANLFSKKK
ncbi:DEAD/DEAH box helicase [Spirochaeta cellobiosiphila]|uniref:DEAD/DEAH box helicase n=1 Tax=Spirochaeta cellobiosiphila TaxID=504483 RepID=UPI000414BD89|nr:DEAD/DEAH box helicase [Spirochaeta cellobiosiphila]